METAGGQQAGLRTLFEQDDFQRRAFEVAFELEPTG